jgi:hypothetical protein
MNRYHGLNVHLHARTSIHVTILHARTTAGIFAQIIAISCTQSTMNSRFDHQCERGCVLASGFKKGFTTAKNKELHDIATHKAEWLAEQMNVKPLESIYVGVPMDIMGDHGESVADVESILSSGSSLSLLSMLEKLGVNARKMSPTDMKIALEAGMKAVLESHQENPGMFTSDNVKSHCNNAIADEVRKSSRSSAAAGAGAGAAGPFSSSSSSSSAILPFHGNREVSRFGPFGPTLAQSLENGSSSSSSSAGIFALLQHDLCPSLAHKQQQKMKSRLRLLWKLV